jgi:hypothetical protein
MGWIRMSIHPTMTDTDLDYVLEAIAQVAFNHKIWAKDYQYDPQENNFMHLEEPKRSMRSYFEL